MSVLFSSKKKEDENKSRLLGGRKTREESVRTDCVVQVPVPQIVDGASRPAHDQRAGSKEKDIF